MHNYTDCHASFEKWIKKVKEKMGNCIYVKKTQIFKVRKVYSI
jgi:hypothetical protein